MSVAGREGGIQTDDTPLDVGVKGCDNVIELAVCAAGGPALTETSNWKCGAHHASLVADWRHAGAGSRQG